MARTCEREIAVEKRADLLFECSSAFDDRLATARLQALETNFISSEHVRLA